MSVEFKLANLEDTNALARVFSTYCLRGIFYLQGDLGAGKTAFSQAFIRASGFEGRVKSPTYTLVEPYELAARNIYHFDLYRLQDPEELHYLGCEPYFETEMSESVNVCLIEWPEKAFGALPSADIEIRIERAPSPELQDQRIVSVNAHTLYGKQILNAMQIEFQSLDLLCT